MTPSQTSCTEEKSLQITMMFKQCVVDPQQKRGVCIYIYIYMYVCMYVYIICFFMIPGRYFLNLTCIKLNGLIRSLPSWVRSLKRTAQFAPENRAIRPKRNLISTPTIDFHGLLIPNTFHAQVKLDHLCRLPATGENVKKIFELPPPR